MNTSLRKARGSVAQFSLTLRYCLASGSESARSEGWRGLAVLETVCGLLLFFGKTSFWESGAIKQNLAQAFQWCLEEKAVSEHR